MTQIMYKSRTFLARFVGWQGDAENRFLHEAGVVSVHSVF